MSDETGSARDEQDQDDRRDTKDGQSDDKKNHKDEGKQKNANNGDDKPRKKPGRKPLIILAVVVILLAIVAFVWWFATRNEITTDDAYTDGNAITMAPKVSGYVVQLAVNDNVYVHKGDLLVVIDKRDYQAQVDQAEAQVGLAKAQLNAALVQLDIARIQYPAQYRQAKAQTSSAEANFRQAEAAYLRQHAVDQRATSQQNIDTADAQRQSASASVEQARAQQQTASLVPQQIRQTEATVEERRQQVQQAEAQLEQAQLNLSYCEVRSPSDGWITRRNVQLGTFLQAGVSLFAIVTPQVWVTANFKESQLERMRPGDKVKVEVDAYPKLDLRGHVDSVQLGSGSRFSAFPAENATGNFVKIVQRVPVKIVIDDGLPRDQPLGLGLSVTPKVYLK
ncbi:efflux transporter, RND family, MFP subunit [Paraburkholderia xenovorans LB400]|jgi:membrane fusion protein, multidrug efflux system|uniref:MFS efflux pump, membrane fusion protein, EmrA subfamily n=1 Tax=Paraburkholderia xenovorans (strain LB400) TaxID=266265 RepID=Q13MQ4_PARXL|nr:HlyD family secretion protein [Paraburkholderia xenovorans]ABE34635.1 MFS efflux pump, membrane fusion protein, EmrA subfamily [Paraburkholderia xenovorans LB400]AIP36629.1 efflux transporter, RND family, MFP subunit [Paraburkholderia xenovorans LB400]